MAPSTADVERARAAVQQLPPELACRTYFNRDPTTLILRPLGQFTAADREILAAHLTTHDPTQDILKPGPLFHRHHRPSGVQLLRCAQALDAVTHHDVLDFALLQCVLTEVARRVSGLEAWWYTDKAVRREIIDEAMRERVVPSTEVTYPELPNGGAEDDDEEGRGEVEDLEETYRRLAVPGHMREELSEILGYEVTGENTIAQALAAIERYRMGHR
ncbi:hypothetical protein Tdes44962_MAKER08094 [Teratosphaeria destructans]|uniref:Uncharacterized protein n=1 Tax=Teratosphaeria destructans TaxID=418781 RepID=A0A9W7SXP6_9PEZI|nr:hypothetical protein Tdes44962_MAKER08094 [Teratosphaeria destructans]